MISTKQPTYTLMNYILHSDNNFKNFGIFLSNFINSNGSFSPDMVRSDNTNELPDEVELPKEPQYMSLRNRVKRERDNTIFSDNESDSDMDMDIDKYESDSENESQDESQDENESRFRKRFRRGGANDQISENMLNLYNSLPKLTVDETQIPDMNETNVLQNNSICFHPLLPVYMITQTYYSAITNEDILASMDFELFVNYFTFLQKIKNTIVSSYSGANDTNKNQMDSYAIGIGLKQLLFISNNTQEGYQSCLNVLGTTDDIYSKPSSLTDNLVSDISGKINLSDIDIENGSIYLESELFKTFAKSLDVNSIFNNMPDSETFNASNFIKEVFQFSVELGEQIVSDRTGVTPRTFQEIIASRPVYSGIEGISSEERAEKARIANEKYQEALAKGNVSPNRKTGIFTGKDLFTYSDGDKSNMVSSSSSSGSFKEKGGKKTYKNKKHKKGKTIKRKNNKSKHTRKRKNIRKHKHTRR